MTDNALPHSVTKNPHAQAKLVRVVKGKVLDVALDLRKDSATYGKHHKVLLDSDKKNLFLVPAGFAHGFVALEDSVFFYKCSNYYNKESEGGILWNDPALQIDWGIEDPIVSEKDKVLPTFETYKDSPCFWAYFQFLKRNESKFLYKNLK